MKRTHAGGSPSEGPVALLVATRKGAFTLKADGARRSWRLSGPVFLGQIVHHMVLDPRDRRTTLMASRTGHRGPTEFRSTDGGDTWEPVAGLNDHPEYREWMGGADDGTPDGPKLHSIVVDPRDASHLYLGMSSGGVHESLDAGLTWRPLVKGLEVVEQLDPGTLRFHDPHVVRLCPARPDRLYQQNHCGIYRLDRPSEEWVRVGKAMPRSVGDIGFPLVLHPRDPETLWVFPMDGSGVWPRTSPGGRPAAFVSRNGGKSFRRLD